MPERPPTESTSSSGRRAWTHLARVGLPFWKSEERWRAGGVLALIVTLLLSLNGLNVVNSYVGRGFMTAVAEREYRRYYPFALLYLAVFAGSTLVAVLYQFTQDRLALWWRLWLSRHLIQGYLERQAFYRIKSGDQIDNPDQRIAEDVKTFTATLLSFLSMVFNAGVTAIAFAGVLWLISPWLLLTAVLYAGLGSLATVYLGRRLPGLDNRQLVREAELRYALVRIREYAAPIALLQGERNEAARLERRLQRLGNNFKKIIAVNRNVGFFTSGYNYLVQIIPVLIVAPHYLRGEVEFGEVTQAAMAFSQILGALSLVVAQFQAISSFAAVVARLGGIEQAIETGVVENAIQVVEDPSRLAYEQLTLKTPHGGDVLIDRLTLEVRRGRRLLIIGSNGAGKSALFHATAGLWNYGGGRIVRPAKQQVLFLLERPFLVPGTLRDQCLYGLPAGDYSDAAVAAAIQGAGLAAVAERFGGLNAERDWANSLSEGEQQVLAVARLLLAKPAFALLDYAVSGMEPGRARKTYETLASTSITYVSIGDRQVLEAYHDTLLELMEGGRWRVGPARNGHVARP